MFHTFRLVTKVSKIARFYQFTSIISPHQNLCGIFVYNNFLQNIVYNISSAHVQSNLHFSTSTHVNADVKIMEGDNIESFDVNYNDILKAQNDEKVLIIDVREQEEIDETGKLPGSIHIPMEKVATTLLSLSDKDFKDKYDRNKPSIDTKIILSCRSGKRSKMVQAEIQKLGYASAYNYNGGWLDWERNQKVQ